MIKNHLFTLFLGLMIGLVFGYVLSERQAVPLKKPMPVTKSQQKLPSTHPRVDSSNRVDPNQQVNQRAEEIRKKIVERPDDLQLLASLGNLYFDASRWEEARISYEKILEIQRGDSNVMTDLAVVYRKLKQPDKALAVLDEVVEADPAHWQALYNMIVILHFDLDRHEAAVGALRALQTLASNNSQIPDMTFLESQIQG